jgi:hypothetical protein
MGGSRKLAIGVGAFAVAAALILMLLLRAEGAFATAQIPQVPQGTFLGVASCGGTTCHGRSTADGPVVRQDEILIWQDPSSAAGAHSRAYAVLREPRSQQIMRNLGWGGDATTEPRCLGCHSTPTSLGHLDRGRDPPRGQTDRPADSGPRFVRADGVGCESCHGPSSGWVAGHYAVGGTNEGNIRRGLIDLADPRVRAGVCLDCHYGSEDPGQFVTHQIMAAGHPRISFELDLFSTLQAHHDEDEDYFSRKGRTNNVQFWAVGQAMALDRSLRLFTGRRGTEGVYPEFYFLDCHSCHRPINDEPRFDPTVVPNPGRPIPNGYPPYNDENMIMLSAAARIAAPAQAARFEAASQRFHAAMAQDRPSMLAAATELRRQAMLLAEAFERTPFTREQVFRIIDTITSRALSERYTDYAGSVQAVMATDTLLSALVSSGSVSANSVQGIRADINAAYQAVREPNAYRPQIFRASLGRAASAIRRLR